jgi:hypothetical protein
MYLPKTTGSSDGISNNVWEKFDNTDARRNS